VSRLDGRYGRGSENGKQFCRLACEPEMKKMKKKEIAHIKQYSL
jgi:hypothetical protein